MDEQRCTELVRQRSVSYDPALPSWDWPLPCEHCGKWGNLQRHHRLFRSRGGEWRASNTILLCARCHELTTAERLPGTGLNVASHENPADVPVNVWYAGRVRLDDLGGYSLAY